MIKMSIHLEFNVYSIHLEFNVNVYVINHVALKYVQNYSHN